MPNRLLARTSHQSPAAAADAPHPAMFSPLGVLDVPSSTPPRPSGRKPHWARHLGTLATNTGEKCGLAPGGKRVLVDRARASPEVAADNPPPDEVDAAGIRVEAGQLGGRTVVDDERGGGIV